MGDKHLSLVRLFSLRPVGNRVAPGYADRPLKDGLLTAAKSKNAVSTLY